MCSINNLPSWLSVLIQSEMKSLKPVSFINLVVEVRLVIRSCCFNFLENIGASEEVKCLIIVDIVGKPRVLQLILDNVYQLSQCKYQKKNKIKECSGSGIEPMTFWVMSICPCALSHHLPQIY